MSRICVTPLSSLKETIVRSEAKNLMSLMGPGKTRPRPNSITGSYLALEFNDISTQETNGLIAPSREHVDQIINFALDWDRKSPLIIHCWMGISRSTAAAAIVSAVLCRDARIERIARAMRIASPMATPNSLMIQHGDEALDLGGKLISTIANIGRGAEAKEGRPFSFYPEEWCR